MCTSVGSFARWLLICLSVVGISSLGQKAARAAESGGATAAAHGAWQVSRGRLAEAVAAAAVVALPDGRVLIAGGDIGGKLMQVVPQGLFITSTGAAEVYDPRSDSFRLLGARMLHDREAAAGVVLSVGPYAGSVLIPGGLSCRRGLMGGNCQALASAELYDPKTGRFTAAGVPDDAGMIAARANYAIAPIEGCHCVREGDILIAGGFSGTLTTGSTIAQSAGPVRSAELYDPRLNRFFATQGTMHSPRENAVAVALGDGRVLIAGGDSAGFFAHSLASAELYDPASDTFTPVASMHLSRELAAGVLLPASPGQPGPRRVLITGGLAARNELMGSSTDTAELFDPQDNSFALTAGKMSAPRTGHPMTVLPDGRVLVAGGIDVSGWGSMMNVAQTSVETADIYDPATGRFIAAGRLPKARGATLVAPRIADGMVLYPGGELCNGRSGLFASCRPLASALLFTP